MIVVDHDGDPVYLTRLQWDIDRVVRDWPAVALAGFPAAAIRTERFGPTG